MRHQRSFSNEFKRQVVEELLSEESRPAQICRIYNIASSLLYHRKRQYSLGVCPSNPTANRPTMPSLRRAFYRLARDTRPHLRNNHAEKGW